MKVIRAPDYAGLSRAAAEIIAAQVGRNPASVLGLATGSTPEGLYAELVADPEAECLRSAAANRVVAHACEQVGSFLFAGDVVAEDFGLTAVKNGCLKVPEGSGLGITRKEQYR